MTVSVGAVLMASAQPAGAGLAVDSSEQAQLAVLLLLAATPADAAAPAEVPGRIAVAISYFDNNTGKTKLVQEKGPRRNGPKTAPGTASSCNRAILAEEGIALAPEREKKRTWKTAYLPFQRGSVEPFNGRGVTVPFSSTTILTPPYPPRNCTETTYSPGDSSSHPTFVNPDGASP